MGCLKLTYSQTASPLFVSANNFNECEKDGGSTYDLDFRNYDAALGRMMQIDGMATKYASFSAYHYSFNNPVMFNDPMGDEPPNPNDPYGPDYNGPRTDPNPTGCKFCDNAPTSGDTMNDTYLQAIGVLNINQSSSGPPMVDNKWCGCQVNAFDVVNYSNPSTQRADYRNAAYDAINDYYQRKSQSAQTEDPGSDLIRRYEQNDIDSWALSFTGYALLENGVGGNYLKVIRKNVVSITNPDRKKDVEKASKIMDLATGFVKTSLSFVKDSKLAAPYLTITGAVLIGKGAALQYENENTLGPKIKEINPDYYNKNIERIYPYQGGGAGATGKW